MPSTTSSSVWSDFASSTVITPSLPTFFIASARNRPISASPLAEMVATWAISSFAVTFLEFFLRSSTSLSMARSMPRLRSMGFIPAATAFAPSLTIAAASTVAVVVPSPAASEVLLATSRTICAPMFSNLSSSSISLATVTPSLVIRGAPKDFSSTTLRPLGPSVTRTELERMSIPRSILSRASTENLTSLTAIFVPPCEFGASPDCPTRPVARLFLVSNQVLQAIVGALATASDLRRFSPPLGLDQHPHDVALLHDQVLDTIDLDFGPRPLAEQHVVADLEVDWDELAGLVASAGTDGDHFALLRFFLGGIGDDNAAGSLLLGFDARDNDSIVKWTELHWVLPSFFVGFDCSDGRSRRGDLPTSRGASFRPDPGSAPMRKPRPTCAPPRGCAVRNRARRSRKSERRSGDQTGEQAGLLFRMPVLRRGRQLQHGRNLTGVQPGQKHDLASGELERIVMCVTLIRVYPPKLSNFSDNLFALVKEVELRFILHVFLEREFRPWKQTNWNSWLSDRSEPTRDRVAKVGRYQLVANLCGSIGDKIQTIVTHRSGSSAANSRDLPHRGLAAAHPET